MDRRNRQTISARRILFVVFIVVAIVVMTLYAREGGSGFFHDVQAAIENVISPLKIVGATADAGLDSASDALDDVTASEETLTELREQNAELTELAVQGEEYRLEAQQLQELLDLKDTYDIDGVAARVIGRTTDAWNQTVTIDVGTSSGVEVGLTVMGPSGVIGQVVSVSPSYSTVRLLSDPNSGAAALVQSSRAEGVVRGSLTGLLYLEDVEADVLLNVGDVVLTSGLGGSYTRGLLIGTIVRIEGNSGDGTQRIVVAPNEETSSLENVIVVFSALADEANDSGEANRTGADDESQGEDDEDEDAEDEDDENNENDDED